MTTNVRKLVPHLQRAICCRCCPPGTKARAHQDPHTVGNKQQRVRYLQISWVRTETAERCVRGAVERQWGLCTTCAYLQQICRESRHRPRHFLDALSWRGWWSCHNRPAFATRRSSSSISTFQPDNPESKPNTKPSSFALVVDRT